MEGFINSLQVMLNHFLIFNQNAFYYIIFFLKNYYIYAFVVAAISTLFYFQVKGADEKFINDKRRII